MKIFFKKISLSTKKQFELLPISQMVEAAIGESGIQNGIVNVFTPHTTASVRLNHNETLLMQDIMKAVYRLVPQDIAYNHDLFELRQSKDPNERSNGNAHVKAFLLGSSETIPLEAGKMCLGTKQTIFFVELDGARSREVCIKIIGE